MARFFLRRTLMSAALGAAGVAAAQPSPPAIGRPADPLDARASAPAATYRSPLAGYRPLADQPVGNWREANDTVARIGGWRQYAREAQQPQPAPAPPRGGDGGAAAPKTP